MPFVDFHVVVFAVWMLSVRSFGALTPRPSMRNRGVLIVNPKSGGGKAARYDLVAQCQARGIEAIVLRPGDDLSALATAAVADGADIIGMAGGDGSQAVVAAVAAEHDIPFVCVPAGTRNHFGFDVGVDRRDVAGALDAFVDGDERRIDLGRVNGRMFVNNVAMGVYGVVIESKDYRNNKVRTVIEMLPELVGPKAEPFDLRFTDGDGRPHHHADLLLVSNDPYELDARPARGTRGALDAGVLGVVALGPGGPKEWRTPTLVVDSASTVAAGIDGESVRIEPPLIFESVPLALRIRTPRRSPRRPARPRPPRRPKGRSALPRERS